MESRQRADAIDARIVFRIYAVAAGLGGFVLSGWGQIWLGSHLADQPWGKAALVRVAGSVLIAAACAAAGFATVEDPLGRRRGLLWFACAHAVVLFAVLLQRLAIWGAGLADWAAQLLLAAALVFLYAWWTAETDLLEPARPSSLLGGTSPAAAARLRSAYERQIRQAAGQEERNRLARDLHDSIKQQIFAIQTAAATAQVRFLEDPSGAQQALAEVRNSAREAMTEMEAMLDQLRAAPLENAGLVEALKKQCEALGFRTGAQVDFEPGKLPPSETLAPGSQQAIFRVAQEALANAGRHARAGSVCVRLSGAAGEVRLEVRDDGSGFDPAAAPAGMGIANMRARAEEYGGKLEIVSRLGGGTSVMLSVPYLVERPAEYRRRALFWGASLGVSIVVMGWTRSIGLIPVAAIAAIGLARETAAYCRTRKGSEAAQ